MKAMIFAAGMGTRLKPLTDVIPKALVPVAGKPLLQHTIERLTSAGCDDIVINVHHHADQIRNFLDTTRQHWGAPISISDESDKLLETGGAIRKAMPQLDDEERFIIHNCDIISNVNINDFWQAGENVDAMLLVSERETQRYLIFDDDMRLVGWTNVKTGEVKSPYPAVHQAFNPDYLATEVPYNFVTTPATPRMYRLLAFSGIHQMTTRFASEMQSWPDKFSVIDYYLALCATHDIRGYVQPDLCLLDVGKLDTLEQANNFINTL